MHILPEAELANRSGAKGSAKPKKCVTCDGKGWKHVYSQVYSFFCARTLNSVLIDQYNRSPLSALQRHAGTCNDCHGTGEILREKDRYV
jgi:DnaJ family protein A protein 2